ncbi:poly-gamma-glutamate hydrolase family protein [Vreelandella massiliensis]|uniref:poly-gamma-glutamate hydrolase family protein n=1 Tax=Vreelandella massiliensis TaxID=1816686 RepID=UPI00135656DB|nr:poly-gamma-glutamate hydrolase family protein [Halomonas massiliensis]
MLEHVTTWLRRKGWIRHRGDRYSNFSALACEQPNGAFSITYADRGSPITIMAIHGGKIEPGTSSLAKRIAGKRFNYYSFSGDKKRHNWDLHITSTAFDEPVALALADRSAVVVTLHGCMGRGTVAYTGGDNVELCQQMENVLNCAGVKSRPHPIFHGHGRNNICNRGQHGGLQLELTPRLRLCPYAWRKRRILVDRIQKLLDDGANLNG